MRETMTLNTATMEQIGEMIEECRDKVELEPGIIIDLVMETMQKEQAKECENLLERICFCSKESFITGFSLGLLTMKAYCSAQGQEVQQ